MDPDILLRYSNKFMLLIKIKNNFLRKRERKTLRRLTCFQIYLLNIYFKIKGEERRWQVP